MADLKFDFEADAQLTELENNPGFTVWVGDNDMSVLWDGEDLPKSVTVRYISKLSQR